MNPFRMPHIPEAELRNNADRLRELIDAVKAEPAKSSVALLSLRKQVVQLKFSLAVALVGLFIVTFI